MSDKKDYYEALGVAKTASADEIKAAYKKIALKNHPDMVKQRNPTAEVVKQAQEILQYATEAEGVLSDPTKRAAYDKFGHKGVENLATGKGASSGQSYTDAAGPVQQRKMPTNEDTTDYFERLRAKREGTVSPAPAPAPKDGPSGAELREAARQERLRNRSRGNNGNSTPPAAAPPAADTSDTSDSPSSVFQEVANKVSDATDALRGGVTLPVDVLVKFRENLADFAAEVDKAIARTKNPGFRL